MALEFLNTRVAALRVDAVTLDADGVLHRGRTILPGALDLLRGLSDRAIPWQVVTNNSRQTAERAAEHYRSIGLPVCGDQVVTAADATAAYIVGVHHGAHRPRVYPLGDADQRACLIAGGCQVTDDEDRAEYVAVGINRRLTYQRLFHACNAIRRGARFVVANLDATVPTETGAIPGAGALAAAIKVATGKEWYAIGKPAPEMMLQALRRMDRAPTAALHVGDRIDSDVPAAARAGMTTALVTTGEHGRDEGLAATGDARPDIIAGDLPALIAWLFRSV